MADVPLGVHVGHWTEPEARTGCTVVLFPDAGAVASGEVRGGAPASREFDLLDPLRMVPRIDAVVLTGGSAFGLAAADGVMAWCEDAGRGFATRGGTVPIVVALALYDLTVGDGSVRPGPAEGRLACDAAVANRTDVGAIGAGTGATVGKWFGADAVRPGGFGVASAAEGDLSVTAMLAVNAAGDLPSGRALAPQADARSFENTTIGVVVTNAALTKTECHLVAQGGHGGLAAALEPAHTRSDGDALVAASVGAVEAHVDHVRALAHRAVVRSVATVLGG